MNARLSLSLLIATAATLALALAPAASAATSNVEKSVSSNWSGYVVQSSSSDNFSSVSGVWVQPSITSSSTESYSVFWVGLGGASGTANSLEQIGTEANYVDGKVVYYAWYELVPSAPVKLDLAIHPGDKINATVSVSGTSVTVAITDQTTGQSVKKTLQMSNPDTSSAEWIAEAPSACNSSGSSCRTLTLSNFGTVNFSNATATSSDGHTGTISDPRWATEAVELSSSASTVGVDGPVFVSEQLSSSSEPSSLSSDGSSFSVSYQGSTVATGSGPPVTGPGPLSGGFAGPPPGF